MRPSLLADADFNQKILRGLRRREPTVDFLDAHAGAVIGLADPLVLAAAASADRILVSHDRRTMPRHFAEFIASNDCPGLIIVSQDLDISAAIEELLLIWAATDHSEWANRIFSIPI